MLIAALPSSQLVRPVPANSDIVRCEVVVPQRLPAYLRRVRAVVEITHFVAKRAASPLRRNRSPYEQGNVLHGVAAVAEAVPARPLGLRTPGKISCAGP